MNDKLAKRKLTFSPDLFIIILKLFLTLKLGERKLTFSPDLFTSILKLFLTLVNDKLAKRKLTFSSDLFITVEPRFNEVAADRPNLFVKWRFHYIENLDITNLSGNDQNVRFSRS